MISASKIGSQENRLDVRLATIVPSFLGFLRNLAMEEVKAISASPVSRQRLMIHNKSIPEVTFGSVFDWGVTYINLGASNREKRFTW